MKEEAEAKVVLRLTIHTAANSLRFGGDGYLVTFAGTEMDKTEALKLSLLNGMALKVTVEEDKAKPDGRKDRNESERSWP